MSFVYDEQGNKSGAFHNFLKYHDILMKDFFVITQKIKKNLYNLNIYLDEKIHNYLTREKDSGKHMVNGRLFQLNQWIVLMKNPF